MQTKMGYELYQRVKLMSIIGILNVGTKKKNRERISFSLYSNKIAFTCGFVHHLNLLR